MSARPAIDARAAARPELGGVERWARELCARLPYTVHRPPARSRTALGHAWEQGLLPLLSARAPALLCPANLAPLAARNVVVVIHDAAPLRRPDWYSGAYAAFQRRVLPLIARRARAVITVSEFSRDELRELLGVEASVVYGGVDPRFQPGPKAERPYVLCVASHTARKNLRALVPAAEALAREGVELRVAGGHRPQFAAERGLGALKLLGHVDDALLPGALRGRRGVRAPVRLRGLRPAGAGGDGERDAGGGDERHRAARDGRRRRAAGATRTPRRSATRWWGCWATAAEQARLRAAGLARAPAFTWERTAARGRRGGRRTVERRSPVRSSARLRPLRRGARRPAERARRARSGAAAPRGRG